MKVMLQRFILVLLLFCYASSAQEPKTAAPDASGPLSQIVELKATGSVLYKQEEILRATGLEKGKLVSLQAVRNAAQVLAGTGVFLEVRYSHHATKSDVPNGIDVDFQVADKPADQYLQCDFRNLVWFNEKELQDALHTQLPLFNGTFPLGGGSSDQAAAVIQQMLEQKGVHTHVSAVETDPTEKVPQQFVRFMLEDVKVKVAAVGFPGASAAMAAELQKVSTALIGKDYDLEGLADFADAKLVSVYRGKGYLRANFDPPSATDVVTKEATTTVTLLLPVHEGFAYTLGDLKLTGNKLRTTEELRALIKSPVGSPLNGEQFESEVKKIRDFLHEFGLFRSKVEVKPAYNDAAKTVSYELVITEGERYNMGKLEIEGLNAKSSELLRTSWKLREGEVYRRNYVASFVSNFKFSEAVQLLYEESPDEATHTVDVTLIVRPLKQKK